MTMLTTIAIIAGALIGLLGLMAIGVCLRGLNEDHDE